MAAEKIEVFGPKDDDMLAFLIESSLYGHAQACFAREVIERIITYTRPRLIHRSPHLCSAYIPTLCAQIYESPEWASDELRDFLRELIAIWGIWWECEHRASHYWVVHILEPTIHAFGKLQDTLSLPILMKYRKLLPSRSDLLQAPCYRRNLFRIVSALDAVTPYLAQIQQASSSA